jgi:hypothetical protein
VYRRVGFHRESERLKRLIAFPPDAAEKIRRSLAAQRHPHEALALGDGRLGHGASGERLHHLRADVRHAGHFQDAAEITLVGRGETPERIDRSDGRAESRTPAQRAHDSIAGRLYSGNQRL